ncbi:MAG: heavy metal-responsive transcriptional regulator [Bacillota bacterium]
MRIGELASRAGVTTGAIRFYEQLGLLRPEGRTPAGYRVFGPGQVERLRFIRAARMLGLSLSAIAEVLAVRDQGRRPCEYVLDQMAKKIDQVNRQIASLERLKRELGELYELGRSLQRGPDRAADRTRCICDILSESGYRRMQPDSGAGQRPDGGVARAKEVALQGRKGFL